MRHVKSPAGSLRAERAAATRAAILESARHRFLHTGYAATTLRAIALGAGVAVQTVYSVFGSKANILRALRASVVDDPAAAAAYASALAADGVPEALEAFARSVRLRWQGGHDIVSIDSKAAAADAEVRAEVAAANARRAAGIRRLAGRLRELDPSFEARRTESLIDALTLPAIYEQLVTVHRWVPDDYEAFLASALRGLVARETTTRGGRPRYHRVGDRAEKRTRRDSTPESFEAS